MVRVSRKRNPALEKARDRPSVLGCGIGEEPGSPAGEAASRQGVDHHRTVPVVRRRLSRRRRVPDQQVHAETAGGLVLMGMVLDDEGIAEVDVPMGRPSTDTR